ncbi:MAG TPA: hypothetical protein DDY78_29760 [Planctomycetales bacterium]|nr:hypothetical protein [Planctomycetales bacterium]
MMRTVGRFGWLLAAVLIGCVLSANPCRAKDDDKAALLAAFARGNALYGEGKYEEAAASYEAALELASGVFGTNSLNTATILNNLAALYDDMGQYAKAEPLYRRALRIREDKLGKDHPDAAQCLNNMANLYDHMGQYAKAEPLYQRSLKIREDKLGKDHPDLADSLNNLANLYYDMGQYAKAEPLYQRSLKIREDKLGKEHPDVARSLHNLAALYQQMGQYAKAEPSYQRSLKIYEDKLGKDHPDVAASLNNLANLFAEQGRWKEAADAADQERRIVRRHVTRVLPVLSEKEQLAFLEHKDAVFFHVAESLALSRREDATTAAQSAGWLLNGKAVAQEALAQRVLAALDARDHAARLGKASAPSSRAEPWVELAEVRKALPADAVLIEISKFQVANFDPKAKGNPWLGYRYAAWVITAEGDVHVVDLGPAAAIEDAVNDVRQALKEAQGSPKNPSTIVQDGEPDAEKAMLKPLAALSKLVLEPLAEHIDSKKRWYISPDASLWLIPWAALPLKDGRYAVEVHTISYLVSGRDLVAVPSKAKPGRPRMMADPDYDLGVAEARTATKDLVGKAAAPDPSLRAVSPSLGRMQAPRLPGTAVEAKSIQPALEKYAGEEAWLYQQDKALEGVFKTFRGPRVLVLSTHGFFLEDQVVAPSDRIGTEEKRPALDKEGKPLENPLLRCGLLLAGCNNRDQAKEGDEDGVLTGLEVAGTDLRGTELVVLSACETGLGEVHNGEGVAGLRQAFQLAGARAVAATLWQIPDRESAKLMGDFFANLGDGKPKAEALREAQLAMIQSRREKNAAAHPFFWAAYTLTGQ